MLNGIDRIIKLQSFDQFYEIAKEKEKVGGGAIRDIFLTDVKGGNAVNIAYCLAKLGVRVTLFTVADRIGKTILKEIFKGFENVNLNIFEGKQGNTTALEFSNHNFKGFNIMLNDVGDISQFGKDKIDSKETRQTLQKEDAVMVVNWGCNLKGTELLEYSFKNSPSAIHFIDPADIYLRREEFVKDIPRFAKFTDVLSINENEFNSILLAKGIDTKNIKSLDMTRDNLIKLSCILDIKMVLHTKDFTMWTDGRQIESAYTFNVTPNIFTGAGDSWDAAYIIGCLLDMEERDKLIISNAYAAQYISNGLCEPPGIYDLINYLSILEK